MFPAEADEIFTAAGRSLPASPWGLWSELREAVDHAASGNYLIDFELRGKGEVVELAKSVRNLLAQVRPAA
jgi:hypothetical protein